MYHFFLWFLSKTVIKNYKITYDYVRHNYFIYRTARFKVIECFNIIRTSEKCFRVFYFADLPSGVKFDYKTFKSARFTSMFINTIASESLAI